MPTTRLKELIEYKSNSIYRLKQDIEILKEENEKYFSLLEEYCSKSEKINHDKVILKSEWQKINYDLQVLDENKDNLYKTWKSINEYEIIINKKFREYNNNKKSKEELAREWTELNIEWEQLDEILQKHYSYEKQIYKEFYKLNKYNEKLVIELERFDKSVKKLNNLIKMTTAKFIKNNKKIEKINKEIEEIILTFPHSKSAIIFQ